MMCSMGPMSALTRADIHTMLNTPPTRGLLLSAMEVCSWSCLCGLCVLLMLPLEPAAFQLKPALYLYVSIKLRGSKRCGGSRRCGERKQEVWRPTDPVGQSWPRGTGSVGRGAQGQ